MNKPKVSICCWTYNHENFIRKTLDGFFMQKTNFDFEIIIHDDASTDNTANIIREYEKKYPDIIRAIYQTENQFMKTSFVEVFVYPLVRGEYVALCEGDDYWTDENKLQKQVDFLDANKDFSICFHPVEVKYDGIPLPDTFFPKPEERFNKTVLDVKDLLKENFIQTNSVMYRWRFNENIQPKDLGSRGLMPLDWYWHLLHAQVGKIGFIDEIMGVYRRHPGGIWSRPPEEIHLKYGLLRARLYAAMEKYFPETLEVVGHIRLAKYAVGLFDLFLKKSEFKKMQELTNICPDAFEYLIEYEKQLQLSK